MPRRRVSRKPRRKSNRRQPRRQFRPIRRSLGSGIPNSIAMKMKYSANLTPTTTTAISNTFYSLSNLFDPDVSGVGHQPYYYDEMTPLYARWFVSGCAYKCTVNSQSGTVQVGVKAQRDVTGMTDITAYPERPGTKYTVASAGGPSKVIKGYYSMPQLWGISASAYRAELNYHGTFDASPSLQQFFQISWQNPDGVSTASGTVVVELTYYVTWTDRKRVTSS